MEIQVLQENINSVLSFLNKLSPSKSSLVPGSGTVTITADKNLIKATAEDLEITITKTIQGKTITEGKTTAPLATLQAVVSLYAKEKITIVATGGTITIKGEKNETSLKEEEMVVGVTGEKKKEEKTGRLFKKTTGLLLERVKPSASSDQARAVLTGILASEGKEGTVFVATDGFRLSRLSVNEKGVLPGEKSVVLPSRVFGFIQEAVEDNEPVLIWETTKEKKYTFETKTTLITTRTIEGQYPDYEKILPKEATTTLVVDRVEFLNAVRLSSVFAKDNANIVRLDLGAQNLGVSADSPHAGKSKSTIEAVGKGDLVTAAFNYRFLIDFLSSLADVEKIKIETSGPLQPASFTAEGDNSYLHIIMPVRVQE